ncbi:MAG TPA: response regulator [Thermodesulfobacteriota bacterium]|nr:response regulator [Thermodesulfobacteriota bacterium]
MKKELRILILEDNPSDAELVLRELRKGNLAFTSKQVDTKETFLKELSEFTPDLILSDYSLPSFDGLSALKIVKESYTELPFIFVTGSLGEERAIETLKSGATDYVLKDRLSRLTPSVLRALQEAEERKHLKRAEEQILQQADLLNIATDAIIVLDIEHQVLFWNKGAERIYGWKTEETEGKNISELRLTSAPTELEEALKTVKDRGEWKGELHQITRDGKEVIVENRCTLVLDSQGNPKSIFIVGTDITEKKRIEAQFLRAQRMESIGTLAGGVAHDLNNVLQPIMMALELLRSKFTDEQSQDWINTIHITAERGANLVKQILSFARGMEGEHTIVQVRHLISEVQKIIKDTFPKSIEIYTDIPKNLWTITGDPTQLHQVLINLCVNARDAMPYGGRLNISAENLFLDENYVRMNIDAQVGPYIAITVSDTGTGIPPEILDRVFEPFFTTKEYGKGTGLGLSTVFGIVKAHGGFINVYSEVGKGTRFKVYLPAFETGETKELGDKRTEELRLGHGELILVVDDEAGIREITKATLEKHGYRVITASDGAEALALYVQNRLEVRVVIVDMVMPIMDGPATIKALQKIDSDVNIIAVSGLKESGESAEAAGIDVDAFLTKPYTAETLLNTLHRVLNGKKSTN